MPTDGKPKNGIVRQLFSYGGVSVMQTFVEFGVFAVLQLAGRRSVWRMPWPSSAPAHSTTS